ncbi:MAG: ABC transporter substrate-binding protein [Draconibacterium sp.]|nr:ABC transporter substrate-binding protein [Draconibacterium sp.]
MAPSITENIYLLGAQDKLVGCTSYCTQAVADGKEIIGTTIEVNVEKIFALQPDLILTMELTKSQDLEAMKKLGLNVELILTPKSFEEICVQTIHIGKLIGDEESAQKVIQETKQIVNDIKQKSAQLHNKQKVFFQIGASPIFTVLQNTFMDEFILLNNAENIANGMTRGTMTRESVLVKNPDVIIVATMGGFGKEEQKIWKSYTGLEAAKNDKIFLIESEIACSPTPDNFAKAFTSVYQFLSQE